MRTITCFNHPPLLENDKTVRDGLSKVFNANFDDISRTQLALPAEMGGLRVPCASLLALPAFLASVFCASDFLMTIFSETFEDVSFTKALQSWLGLTKKRESPLDGTQKNWKQPVYVKTAQGNFLEWMTNVRKFSTLIKASSSLNGSMSFFART